MKKVLELEICTRAATENSQIGRLGPEGGARAVKDLKRNPICGG